MPLAEPVLAPRQQLRTGIFPPLVHWSQSLRSLSQHHFSARHARPYGGPSSLSAVHPRSTRSSNCLRRQSVFIIRPKCPSEAPWNVKEGSKNRGSFVQNLGTQRLGRNSGRAKIPEGLGGRSGCS